MHAVRQKCRPKHQILILKCYPRYQKNVPEVKAQPSELSYLLYYASTRRSKLQKVGLFLQHKAVADVAKNRIGNVQVTLQILTALIERLPRDLPLFAEKALTIINDVLGSNELVMLEESVTAFGAFCHAVDDATLVADPILMTKYQSIISKFAHAADLQVLSGRTLSTSLALRWRTVGFCALQHVTASPAVAADQGEQLNLIVPVILRYLRGLDRHSLLILQEETANSARKSVESSAPPIDQATITTDDADRRAEEVAYRSALVCLKQIFGSSSRGQTRMATSSILRSLDSVSQEWAVAVVEMSVRWSPVQDRFVVLVTLMEALLRSPLRESSLDQHLLLCTIVGALLRSDINMIGLSVMDVLLGLMQHILLVLQLGNRDQSRNATIDLFKEFPQPSMIQEEETTPSPTRESLLLRLQKCVGDLATHIYYSDQISDIVTTVLSRLKPSPAPDGAAAVEHPEAAIRTLAKGLHEDASSHEFFSFTTARITALQAVKDVLIRSNAPQTARVSLEVWSDTQWLLRDADHRVRIAYLDALMTWLKLETDSSDLQVQKSFATVVKRRLHNGEATSQRTVSNASRSSRIRSRAPMTLQLLHLAVYDNAIEDSLSEFNILCLHLLLCYLIAKLGVNAARSGLPMILRLQNDIATMQNRQARISVGSLVHGYLAALCEKFDLDTSPPGLVIHAEIERRKKDNSWLQSIQLPPRSLETLVAGNKNAMQSSVDVSADILPFDQRAELVQQIAEAYTASMCLPPGSPPTSPRQEPLAPPLSDTSLLPSSVRDEMLHEWNKAEAIAATESRPRPEDVSISPSLFRIPQSVLPSPSVHSDSGNEAIDAVRYLRVADMKRVLRQNIPSRSTLSSAQDSQAGLGSTSLPEEHLRTPALDSDTRRLSVQPDSPTLISQTQSEQGSTTNAGTTKRGSEKAIETTRTPAHKRSSEQISDRTKFSSQGNAIGGASSSTKEVQDQYESQARDDRHRPSPIVVKNSSTSRSRPHSGSEQSYGALSTPRSHRRLSTTSSSAAGEDADLNAAALRGDPSSQRLSIDLGYGLPESVPPVPPIPKNMTTSPISSDPWSDVPGNLELPPPKHIGITKNISERIEVPASTAKSVTALLDSMHMAPPSGQLEGLRYSMGPPL